MVRRRNLAVLLCLALSLGPRLTRGQIVRPPAPKTSPSPLATPLPPDVVPRREGFAEKWDTDLEAARRRAARAGRPLFLFFWAPWAAPSATMRDVLTAPEVERALRALERVEINLDDQPDMRSRFGVEELPTFVLLDTNGREYDRFGGFLPPGAFLDTLEAAADPKQSIAELEKHLKRSTCDQQARWLLARKYARDKNREGLDRLLDDMRRLDPENRQGYLDRVAYLELMTSLDVRIPADGLRAAEQFLKQFPKSEVADQVELTLAHLAYQMGDKRRCLEILEKFAECYPKSPLAEQVRRDLEKLRAELTRR